MSNLDPFTQKLLERTQARKEAAKNKRQAPVVPKSYNQTVKINRAPLAEKNDILLSPDKNGRNKRRSSEGVQDVSLEKKSKTSDNDHKSDEGVFAHRQNSKNAYVIPSSAGRTPKKLNCGSLASRLAHLNDDYNEKFQLDAEENQRKDEAKTIVEERKKEHLRIQEEERSRRIQEKIFGKNHVAAKNEPAKQKPLNHMVTARQPLKTSSAKAKFFEETTVIATSIAGKKKKVEERTSKIVAGKASQEEAVGDFASVNDKMSLFEQKMKQEHDARQKEIEVEKRLRHKTPRKQVTVEDKEINAPQEIGNLKKSEHVALTVPSEEEVEVDPLLECLKSPCPRKGETGMLKHARSYAAKKVKQSDNAKLQPAFEEELQVASPKKAERKTATPKEEENKITDAAGKAETKTATPKKEERRNATPRKGERNVHSLSKIRTPLKEERSKNYTGDINSPQPIDCTEDTVFTDSKAFDISEILRVAEREKVASPTKTPHRSSTMKVQFIAAPVVQPLLEIDVTPVQLEYDDEPSEFTKKIRNRKANMKVTACQLAEEMDMQLNVENKKERPQKPPRTRCPSDLPPTYEEYVAAKTGQNIIDDDHNANLVIAKPVEIVSRKKLRRSVSFSEGQKNTPVKSGYNKDRSSHYNAHSSFDKPDIVYSKRDQIQNLLEEAANQQNIVLQTSQALNVAESSTEDKRGSPEVIEGERLLLLATEKRTACLEEVRELKETDSVQFLNELQTNPPCKAALALTEMKLPLHHDFVSALRGGRMDLGIFHFVIIVSCGSRNVFSTKVVSSYDEMEACSLLMNSNLLMRNVPHDFTLSVKVFGLHTRKGNDSHAKIKRTYTNNQSPGNLKNLFSKRKEDDYTNCASPQTVFRTSNFKLIGETKINLSLLGNGSKHVLNNVPSNCPIEGFVQLRVACKPEFTAAARGFLTILEDVGGYTAWNRRWCNMKDNKILYWRYPDDEETKEPLGGIQLKWCTDQVVKLLSRDKCARPHTFELNTKRATEAGDESNLVTTIEGKTTITKHWICADNKDDRVTWMEAVNKQLSDSRAWLLKHATKKSSKSNDIMSSELGRAVAV